jgi:hypothetical protein
MSKLFSRILAVLGGLISAVVCKWVFDHWLWDAIFGWLAAVTDFGKAESITAVLSYLLPLVAGTLAYVALSPHAPENDRPALRKSPWQSGRFIVGLLVIIAAAIAGLSYGRVFGLPSITLPQSR